MHLRGTTPQQIDEGCIERHDRIAQMDSVLLVSFLSPKPGREKQKEVERDGEGAEVENQESIHQRQRE